MSEAAGYGARCSWPAQQAIFLLSTHPPSTYSQVGAMERASSTTATAADTPSAAYATPVFCTATPNNNSNSNNSIQQQSVTPTRQQLADYSGSTVIAAAAV